MNKESGYQTLEQQIISLWKSRGMNVHEIQFRYDEVTGFYVWTIRAKIKIKDERT